MQRGYTPEHDTGGVRAYILGEFKPNFDLTLKQAAQLSGYDHFNWYQVVTSDTNERLTNYYKKKGKEKGFDISYPLTDPPGGTTATAQAYNIDSYPYYYEEDINFDRYYGSPKFNLNDKLFSFRDRPTVHPGSNPFYNGKVEFTTYLVGVSKEEVSLSEALFNVNWSSTYYPDGGTIVDGSGRVSIGDKKYTLTPPETDFYGNDLIFTGHSYVFIKASEPPKSLDFLNALSGLDENTIIGQGIKVADIDIADDDVASYGSKLTTPIIRFRNNDKPGTYLFAGEQEATSIRQNNKNFVEEGIAFPVAISKTDPLMQPFYRFKNTDKGREGTYLFAGEQEAASIRKSYKNFVEEGLAFYAFPAGVGGGTTDFMRFQNKSLPGTYLFTGPSETKSVLTNPGFILEGSAFAAGG